MDIGGRIVRRPGRLDGALLILFAEPPRCSGLSGPPRRDHPIVRSVVSLKRSVAMRGPEPNSKPCTAAVKATNDESQGIDNTRVGPKEFEDELEQRPP
jgi:hypothetical protein